MSDFAILGPVEPLVRASVTDQVFDALHAQVLSLALPPGTRLSESDVARQLGVSRQPVRDAFYRLSKLGFLLIRPQKATQVSKIHISDVRRARFIRTAIEVDVMRLAADRFGHAEFAVLDSNLAAQGDAVARGDRPAFHRIDDEFHQTLCSCAGVGYVWDVIRENKAHTDRLRFLSLVNNGGLKRAFDDHAAVVTALRQGDAAAAITAMRTHLGNIEGIIQQLRANNHSWISQEE